MPGPVSDSYDPEFGTGENASAVREAVEQLRQRITDIIGSDDLRNIVQLVRSKTGVSFTATLTENEWRILRFAANRALKSL